MRRPHSARRSEAVGRTHAAGIGAQIALDLGGKVDHVFSQPVQVTARVAALSQGVTLELPDRGACNLGRTALLEVGRIRIVVLDQRSFAINHPVLYTHLGLEIAEAKMVVRQNGQQFPIFRALAQRAHPRRFSRNDPIRT